MAKQTILVVDDEPAWTAILGRFFGGHGYNVLTAASCSAAIETAQTHKPDCIILDFTLGDGDAYMVCSAIREAEKRRIPIIVFSGSTSADDCLTNGCLADRLLFKADPLGKLLAAVQELLMVPN